MGAALPLALGGAEFFDFITIRVLFLVSAAFAVFAGTRSNVTAPGKCVHGLGESFGSDENAGTSFVRGGGKVESF